MKTVLNKRHVSKVIFALLIGAIGGLASVASAQSGGYAPPQPKEFVVKEYTVPVQQDQRYNTAQSKEVAVSGQSTDFRVPTNNDYRNANGAAAQAPMRLEGYTGGPQASYTGFTPERTLIHRGGVRRENLNSITAGVPEAYTGFKKESPWAMEPRLR